MSEYQPEDRYRKVRMSTVLMDALAQMAADQSGDNYESTLDWGEPDAEGFYTPTLIIKNKALPEPVSSR